ncbi:MAG: hypothetical protein Q7J73_08170, partial [Dehalococcoidales bacterium]|nr:hypothetical protein [Dehalococcoidales bacterium]
LRVNHRLLNPSAIALPFALPCQLRGRHPLSTAPFPQDAEPPLPEVPSGPSLWPSLRGTCRGCKFVAGTGGNAVS